MIVGHFGLKETPYSEVTFWLPLSEFSFVSRILQPNFIHLLNYFLLLCNQTQSLLALIPCERNEWAQRYSRDEKALSSRPPWSGLKIKVYEILSQQRDIWEIVLCFVVILSFSVTTQITAANQTRLVIHSSKRKGGMLYKWSLELLTGFSATTGCYFLGKTTKTVKWTGQKKTRKTAIIVDKTENQRLNSRKPANRGRKTPKPKNLSFQVRKPKNRTKHWSNPQNRKSQRPPPPGILKQHNCRLWICITLLSPRISGWTYTKRSC